MTRAALVAEDGPPAFDGGRIEGAKPMDAAFSTATPRLPRACRPSTLLGTTLMLSSLDRAQGTAVREGAEGQRAASGWDARPTGVRGGHQPDASQRHAGHTTYV